MAKRGCFHCRPPELVDECLAELQDEGVGPVDCLSDPCVLSRPDSFDGIHEHRWLEFAVPVPDGRQAGDVITFHTPDKTAWKLRVPAGKAAGDTFQVKLPRPQRVSVLVPRGKRSGDSFKFVGPDDKVHVAVVPPGLRPGEAFSASVYYSPPQHGIGLEESELVAWLDAARAFTMNSEFDLARLVGTHIPNLTKLIASMTGESDNNITVQALADKLTLSQLLGNLDLPMMPTLLSITDPRTMKEEIDLFVDQSIASDDKSDMVLKPIHLSSGQGVLVLKNSVREDSRDITIQSLERHIKQYWSHPRALEENGTLVQPTFRTLRPGFLLQPKYESLVAFPTALELRAIALWGKVRLGVWWWGAFDGPCPKVAHRNTWIVRRQVRHCRLSDDDTWEVLHQHSGDNPGFDAAHKILLHHMPAIARMTERLSTVVGAPFLRVDFFVGSPQWGLRLNSVAFAPAVDLRRKGKPWSGQAKCPPLIDDAPAMAQILMRGMQEVKERKPSMHFLSKLGVRGNTYDDMTVDVLLPNERLPMPMCGFHPAGFESIDYAVPADLCNTPRSSSAPSWGTSSQGRSAAPASPRLRERDEISTTSSQADSFSLQTPSRKINFQSPNMGMRPADLYGKAQDQRAPSPLVTPSTRMSESIEARTSPNLPSSPSSQAQSSPRIGGVHCFVRPEVRDKLLQNQTGHAAGSLPSRCQVTGNAARPGKMSL